MLDDLIATLGTHADGFDLDAWVHEAQRRAATSGEVIPDWWKWLKAETLAEAQRRGLPIGSHAKLQPAERSVEADAAEVLAILQRAEAV